MAIFVGVDEAGYGPHLGPLVVSLTAWQLDEKEGQRWSTGADPPDLYDRLAEVVTDREDDERLAIADSKQLYQRQQGLASLERAVVAGLAVTGHDLQTWSELIAATGADPRSRRLELPWYAGYDCELPTDSSTAEVESATALLSQTDSTASVRLLTIRSRAVFPGEFNQRIAQYGSKSAALSHVTLDLVGEVLATLGQRLPRRGGGRLFGSTKQHRRLDFDEGARVRPLPHEPTWVICDKHGSRDRYGSLLEHHFPHQPWQQLTEGRAESRYRCGNRRSPLFISFCRSGERFLPTALASMTSKYLRELAMRALNAYWQSQVPGLRPTAGYPLDARRFQGEIKVVQDRLGIDDRLLWRVR